MKDTHSLAAPRPLEPALLAWPLLWAALFGALQAGLLASPWRPAEGSAAALLSRLVETGAVLGGVWLLIRLLDLLLWQRWLPRWRGAPTPGLLRQGVAVLLVLVTLALLLNRSWGLALPAVLATTGVLGVVLGLALRNILADFFSGLALNIEKPFDLGDFILLRVRGQRDPLAGTVREVNWRSTRLLTPEDNLISVPNSLGACAAEIDPALRGPRPLA